NISLDLIKYKYNDKSDKSSIESKKKEVDEIIKKAKYINEKHITYFRMINHVVNHNNQLKNKLDNISLYKNSFNTSSINKKIYLYELICDVYLSLSDDAEKDFDYITAVSDFINDSFYDKYEQKDELSSYNLLKSIVIRNKAYVFNEYRDLIIKASQCSDAKKNISNILDSFLIQLDSPDLALAFILSLESEITSLQYNNAMIDIETHKHNYANALEYIEKSYNLSSNFNQYVQTKSFHYIKSGNYKAAIKFVDDNIKGINSKHALSICKINKQTALKLLGEPVNKNDIRNIIAQKDGNSINLACYCLLDEKVNIKRLIDLSLAYNKELYELYKYWPVID
ncbi:hypothetical protein C0W59_22370, partial [Photobacterium kishitanii]|uniref:hypothetical protein n=1 Tax=Photobacterium kishitanii TaxID=318456 RepID=UPI000D493619